MSDPLFDTNIVIDWLRQRPEAGSELSRYNRHRISRITWAEVLAGEPPGRRGVVIDMIRPFAIVEVDAAIAEAAAAVRHNSRLKLLDALVYATAQVNGAILVTRNTKDFPAKMLGVRIPYTL